MLVDIVIDFKDGHISYYAGERVWMEPADAAKFVGYGWAVERDGRAPPAPTGTNTTLTIHDGQIGHISEH